MGPWPMEEITKARRVPLFAALDLLGAYNKCDHNHEPLDLEG